MELCQEDACSNEVNRDGVCFKHKVQTIRFGVENVKRQRRGEGPGLTGYESDREYVEQMYEARREEGLPDPVPANSKAAAFAPAMGVKRDKKYREANGGI